MEDMSVFLLFMSSQLSCAQTYMQTHVHNLPVCVTLQAACPLHRFLNVSGVGPRDKEIDQREASQLL